MRYGTLHSSDGCLRVRVQRTATAWERSRGLLGRPAPAPGAGLIISPCSSIHMFGMRYPIDAIYLCQDWTVMSILHALRPWRASWGGPGARHVLEMAAGEAQRLGLERGQQLTWVESDAR